MRIRFFGLSCVGLALLCGGLTALLVFLGAILVGQSVNNMSFPVATTAPTTPPLQASPTNIARLPTIPPSDLPGMGVTLIAPDASTSPDGETATPILISSPGSMTVVPSETPAMPGEPLGTLGYPLTVTAQAHVLGTQVNAYRGSVDATRTTAAQRVIPTHLALTLTASAGK